MLVDVHCHLTHDSFKGRIDEVLKNAKEAGVSVIICSGVNVPTNREALELSKKYSGFVRCSLGLYPIDLLGIQPDESGLTRQIQKFNLDEELNFIEQHKDEIAAIGECGLDYHWDKDHHEEQKVNFQKITAFVKKINKPILVHTRKAEADCVEILEKSGIKKVVLHMFEGRKNLIKKAAGLGWYFTVPAILAKSSHFKMLVEMVDINQLLTETDAPWMSPIPGKTNESANVALTIKEIAKIKKMDDKEVEKNIYMNYQKVFL
jgi:TatD DNase family protein